jgi:hypothetical protein
VGAPHAFVAYSCVLDLVTGSWTGESTDEFFYNDIASMSTKTEGLSSDRKSWRLLAVPLVAVIRLIGVFVPMVKTLFPSLLAQFSSAEVFWLTSRSGESIKIFMRAPGLAQELSGTIPTEKAETAIAAVRTMLRDKKQMELSR